MMGDIPISFLWSGPANWHTFHWLIPKQPSKLSSLCKKWVTSNSSMLHIPSHPKFPFPPFHFELSPLFFLSHKLKPRTDSCCYMLLTHVARYSHLTWKHNHFFHLDYPILTPLCTNLPIISEIDPPVLSPQFLFRDASPLYKTYQLAPYGTEKNPHKALPNSHLFEVLIFSYLT